MCGVPKMAMYIVIYFINIYIITSKSDLCEITKLTTGAETSHRVLRTEQFDRITEEGTGALGSQIVYIQYLTYAANKEGLFFYKY